MYIGINAEKFLKLIKYFLFLVLLTGCSLKQVTFPHQVKSSLEITTTPARAKVYLFSIKQDKLVELGETPLKVSLKDLLIESKSQSIKLTVSKNGYIKEHIIINKNLSNKKIQVQLEDAYNWSKKGQKVTSYALNGSWEDLQKINRLVRLKKYSESLIFIDEMIKDYKYASILYDMKGSILTLLNRKDEAQIYYLKAKSLRDKE